MQYPVMPVSMKDKRKPDHLVKFYAPRAVEIPRQIDWSTYNAKRFNQRNRSMCVGAAFAELMANDAARIGIIPPGLPLFYSPFYIYNWARFMRGWLNEDCGSLPEDAAQAICEHGVLRYNLMPATTVNGEIAMNTADPTSLEPQASKYPDIVKSRIDNGVDGLLAALADGVATVAVPWFDKWGSSYKSGVLPPIASEEMSGRHDILFDGFDQTFGLFYGPNTWGDWGIQESALGMRPTSCGFAMPFEYLEVFKSKFGGYDAWDIDFGMSTPEPPQLYKLILHSLAAGDTSFDLAAGSKAEIWSGKKAGKEFSSWKPSDYVSDMWSAKTTVDMIDTPIEVRAYFTKQKAKRCDLFAFAKSLNKAQGI